MTKIPLGRKVGKVLGFSRAPRLTFRLELSIASVLQKGNPYHVPFEMRAIPQWVDTSERVVKLPLIIGRNKFALAVRSTLSIMAFAAGAVGPVTVVRENHFTTKLILADYSSSHASPLILPSHHEVATLHNRSTRPKPFSINLSVLNYNSDSPVRVTRLHCVFSIHLNWTRWGRRARDLQ